MLKHKADSDDLKGAREAILEYLALQPHHLQTTDDMPAQSPTAVSKDELRHTAVLAPKQAVIALDLLAHRLDSINLTLMKQLRQASLECGGTRLVWKAIRRAGIYAPPGLPSSAMTFLSAAKMAGVGELVLYHPYGRDRGLDPLSAHTALRYGAAVWTGRSRYAFPSLAFGLPGDPASACPLVCGPCGRFMNLLKQLSCVQAGVAFDMSAGPSDLTVIADDSAPCAQIRLDLLSQLEHGPDSRAWLVVLGDDALKSWERAEQGLEPLDARVVVHLARDVGEVVRMVNHIAPESAELWLADPAAVLSSLQTCGVAYVGYPGSLGDYAAIGRGCADPTGGSAAAQSGLSPATFMRLQAEVTSDDAPGALREAAAILAEYEGLSAHHAAITYPGRTTGSASR